MKFFIATPHHFVSADHNRWSCKASLSLEPSNWERSSASEIPTTDQGRSPQPILPDRPVAPNHQFPGVYTARPVTAAEMTTRYITNTALLVWLKRQAAWVREWIERTGMRLH